MTRSSYIHPCSGFKGRKICLPSIPEEIIFKFLLCLPVDILYNVMRYVCREWYNIIKDPKFIDAHCQKSPTGFLIQVCSKKQPVLYLEMKEHDGVEVTDLNFPPKGTSDGEGCNCFLLPSQSLHYKKWLSSSDESLKFPGTIVASCNGLVLVSERSYMNCFWVANLISRQWVRLPPLIDEKLHYSCGGLGYADSCKAYKVAYAYYAKKGRFYCAILTLGVDKAWRRISFSNRKRMACMLKVETSYKSFLFMGLNCSTRGYIHWTASCYVLSLEVETESFHVSILPRECCFCDQRYYLAMDNCLSVAGFLKKYIFKVWALVDVKTGRWKKLFKLDLEAWIQVIEQRYGVSVVNFTPVAVWNNGELFMLDLLCNHERAFMIGNVKTGTIVYFRAPVAYPHSQCFSFVKSLVSPMV